MNILTKILLTISLTSCALKAQTAPKIFKKLLTKHGLHYYDKDLIIVKNLEDEAKAENYRLSVVYAHQFIYGYSEGLIDNLLGVKKRQINKVGFKQITNKFLNERKMISKYAYQIGIRELAPDKELQNLGWTVSNSSIDKLLNIKLEVIGNRTFLTTINDRKSIIYKNDKVYTKKRLCLKLDLVDSISSFYPSRLHEGKESQIFYLIYEKHISKERKLKKQKKKQRGQKKQTRQ